MPQPPAYIRTKDFTENFGSETDHSALNAELDAAGNSINDIRDNLAVLQADDGKLRPSVVTPDSISPELRADLVNRVVLDSQQLLADAETAAATATAGANTAATKRDEAVGAAITATTKRDEATVSATTASDAAAIASTKRDEAVAARDVGVAAKDAAVAARDTATTKRDEAVAAATTASTKRDEAVAARDTATTKRDEAVAARDTAVTKAGEASNSAIAAANSALNASSKTAVKGLKGNVNAGTPLTKFDLSTDEVVLRDANGNTIKRQNTGVLTVDLGLAGPSANGRDQAAPFAANSWVNLFYVWNGVVLALVASTASHTAGPVLPAGYTHWCYATTIRWNASSNIFRVAVAGDSVTCVQNVNNNLIASGTSDTFATLSLSAWAPPNALLVGVVGTLAVNHGTAGAAFGLYLRPTGSGLTAGRRAGFVTAATVGVTYYSPVAATLIPGTGTSIDYRLDAVPSGSGGVYLDMDFYTVPNGDA